MICHHDVTVAVSETHGKATHVIGVELANGLNPDVEFRVIDGGKLAGDVRKGVEGDRLRLFLRGTDAFSRLGEVSFEGIGLRKAVLGSIGKGEAGP